MTTNDVIISIETVISFTDLKETSIIQTVNHLNRFGSAPLVLTLGVLRVVLELFRCLLMTVRSRETIKCALVGDQAKRPYLGTATPTRPDLYHE